MVVARKWGPIGTSGIHLDLSPSVLPTYFANLSGVLGAQPSGSPLPTPPANIPPTAGALRPDLTRRIWHETNVDIPVFFKTKAAYDLDFYPEQGKPTRGVLVVTIILSFKFKDGPSQLNPGATLAWASTEKQQFMDDFRNLCHTVWSEKHRLLTTATPIQPIVDAGVVFNIKTEESMWFFEHSHWNVVVTKVDDPNFHISSAGGPGGGVFTNGDADLDNLDLLPTPGLVQRAAAHEFGHMLGYRDEYAGATVLPNTSWLSDHASIMNIGETVQDRHYVFFADWLSKQKATSGATSSQTAWKVNGRIDLANARV